ncbi:hypothetical protein C8J46_11129 [Sphingomonas sp. PP-F2F-A104-K0414]|nr:hypothetical protein C8J46_11129 [Sphingomonas sp. PP-F2F-A104-K0414]
MGLRKFSRFTIPREKVGWDKNARLRTFVVSFTLAAGSAKRRSKMSYQTDRRSRTRAIAVYVTLLMIGAALGFLVRFGVITDHILW